MPLHPLDGDVVGHHAPPPAADADGGVAGASAGTAARAGRFIRVDRKGQGPMRILAGLYKGRKLLPPPTSSQTRPITGAAKKSLFDLLGGRLEGAAVVDVYCGTGTLGLEALSRGARACWFAERDRKVIERLRRNLEAVGAAGRCTVWPGDAARFLGRRLGEIGGPVDVAFVDPPYAAARQWSWPRQVGTIFGPLAGHLAAEGVVVLRVPAGAEPPDPLGPLAVARRKRFGEMLLLLLGRSKAE